MNILSLFDGISCGQVALNRAQIAYSNYFASEVDKHAIKVTQANYPNTVQLGDVTKWREWDIDFGSINLLIGGSPCQGFSFAGKQLAFDDPRSKLFFIYVDVLNHIKRLNPDVKFMLENVKMSKEHLTVISDHVGVEPVLIDSALVSAQNRKRYYWANWDFKQPKDESILLSDIVDDRYDFEAQSKCWHKWWNENRVFQLKKRYSSICNNNSTNKAICLTARQYASWNGNFLIMQTPRGFNKGGLKAIDGKTPTLSSCSWQENNKLTDGLIYRRLTPVECERLQTLPRNYTNHVSNAQRYKMLGNGWTVDVIAHIFRCLPVT